MGARRWAGAMVKPALISYLMLAKPGGKKGRRLGPPIRVQAEAGPGQFDRVQAQAIATFLVDQGIDPKDVGSKFGYSAWQCKAWHKRWQKEGLRGGKNRPGQGRPHKLTDDDVQLAAAKFKSKKVNSLRECCNFKLACPNTWVKELRRVLGYMAYSPNQNLKMAPLTVTHKTKRLEYCVMVSSRARKAGMVAYSKKITFSDSKVFSSVKIGRNGGRWHVRSVNEDQLEKQEAASKSVYKVHAYGAVTRWGGTRIIINVSGTGNLVAADFDKDGNPTRRVAVGDRSVGCRKGVNAEEYQKHILPKLLADCKALFTNKGCITDWWWQQDGAGPHSVADPRPRPGDKKTPTGIQKECLSIIKQYTSHFELWPARSPDLSLIENVWALMLVKMDDDVKDGKRYHSQKDFEDHVLKAWEHVTGNEELMRRMFEGWVYRLEECVILQGGKTNH